MNKKFLTVLLILTMVFMLCLTGCSDNKNDMDTPKYKGDNVVYVVKDDIKDVGDDVKDGADKMGDDLKDGAKDAGDDVKDGVKDADKDIKDGTDKDKSNE